jgi:hypothetical protein
LLPEVAIDKENEVVLRVGVGVGVGVGVVTIALEGELATEVPTEFTALTVNVYEVPAVKPVRVIVPLPD